MSYRSKRFRFYQFAGRQLTDEWLAPQVDTRRESFGASWPRKTSQQPVFSQPVCRALSHQPPRVLTVLFTCTRWTTTADRYSHEIADSTRNRTRVSHVIWHRAAKYTLPTKLCLGYVQTCGQNEQIDHYNMIRYGLSACAEKQNGSQFNLPHGW